MWHKIMRNWTDTWFMGVQCSQYAVDFVLWERLLNTYRDAKRIVELGTLFGGFSLFLLLQSEQRGMSFVTFDDGSYEVSQYKTSGPMAVATQLGKIFDLENYCIQGDIFADQLEAVTLWITDPGRAILFCDDGNKPREFAAFAPVAKPGDIIVVHDWGTEILEKDIDYTLVEEILTQECDALGSMTRFFVRKET